MYEIGALLWLNVETFKIVPTPLFDRRLRCSTHRRSLVTLWYLYCILMYFFILLQRTPMEVAAERGHKDIVHYLRDANSDVNIRLQYQTGSTIVLTWVWASISCQGNWEKVLYRLCKHANNFYMHKSNTDLLRSHLRLSAFKLGSDRTSAVN